jgi:hypothetical protein
MIAISIIIGIGIIFSIISSSYITHSTSAPSWVKFMSVAGLIITSLTVIMSVLLNTMQQDVINDWQGNEKERYEQVIIPPVTAKPGDTLYRKLK